jgi:hypothetical protein
MKTKVAVENPDDPAAVKLIPRCDAILQSGKTPSSMDVEL